MINQTKIFLFSLTFALFSLAIHAQKTENGYNTKNYKKDPIWIQMMNDPDANYYETIKAFREYWKDRVLPKEPFENESVETFEKEVGLEEEGESKKEKEREERKRVKNSMDNKISYAAEVRAFKGWMQDAKHWLRSDGSIITAEERQKIISQQVVELKEIELKNGKK